MKTEGMDTIQGIECFDGVCKRMLSTSATYSTVSGNATMNMEPFVNYTINVDAKDVSSNLVGTGGDSFYVRISNECTIANLLTSVTGDTVVGAQNTLTNPIEMLMTYNGDSTYTLNFTMNVTGTVSLVVILRNTGLVYSYWYDDYSFTAPVYSSNISTQISFTFGTGTICGGIVDYASAYFKSYLRPNVTDTYTIYLKADDGFDVYLNGVRYLNRVNIGGGDLSFNIALTADTNYLLEVYYQEATSNAYLYLDWAFTGQTRIRIPSTNLVWPLYVGSSPYTFTISCQSGYTASDTKNPNECYPIGGDSLKLGVEVCDDGNTNDNDGGSSDCLTVEYNCTGTGGTSTSKDTCSCYSSSVKKSSYGIYQFSYF